MWDWIIILGIALIYFSSGWLFVKDLGWKWYNKGIAWILWLPALIFLICVFKFGKGGGGWI